jgi:hypothetical protein
MGKFLDKFHEFVEKGGNVYVALALSPIWLTIGFPLFIRDTVAYRAFLRSESGRLFLVCTSKGSWFDFLQNDLIPLLSNGTEVIWHSGARDYDGGSHKLLAALRHYDYAISKPFIAKVEAKGIKVKSLNAELQSLKGKAERSSETRECCRKIVYAAVEEIEQP